jgi:hypothetical protein
MAKTTATEWQMQEVILRNCALQVVIGKKKIIFQLNQPTRCNNFTSLLPVV